MKHRNIYIYLFLGFIVVGSLVFLDHLLRPKYMDDIVEGALIEEYYKEPYDHDVIFIGDCEVYENFSPVTLWEQYGITSYIRGSAQQLIWQSYYLLEDTLRYEKPKVVVFNVLSMKYNEPQKEAYNRMSIDGMKWSMSKVKNIQASMTEEEHFIEYAIPLLRYHSRWSELSSEDIKYLNHRDPVSHNGYYMRVDVKPAGTFPANKKLGNYQFGENAYDYLDRITTLCKENGIQLVLIKAPSLYPSWYDEWDRQIAEYAEDNGLLYLNFLNLAEETGVDFQTDTYDGGLHMNLSGAEKLSVYFGQILQEQFQLENHQDDPVLKARWDKKVSAYQQEKAEQEQDLELYGYIKKYHEE